MKKFMILVFSLFLAALAVGLNCRTTYTNQVDLNDRSTIGDYRILVSLQESFFTDHVFQPAPVIYGTVSAQEDAQPESTGTLTAVLEKEYESAETIVRARATGHSQALRGSSQQEIEIMTVCSRGSDLARPNYSVYNTRFQLVGSAQDNLWCGHELYESK